MADATITINVKLNPNDPLQKLTLQTKEAEKQADSLTASFAKVGAAIAGLSALKGTFDFVLNATRQMEDLTTQFITFTGSADAAAEQLPALSDFANSSPFELAEIATANRTLLAFGSTTKQSLEQLRQLGEVSAATGENLGDLARVFGQIQAEGKLTGERFNQLIERGVNIGPELAKSLGVAGTAIRGLISDSKISADEVAKAFEKMTSEGGQFFGATDRLSKTVSGQLSTLSDAFTTLGAQVGAVGKGPFSDWITVLTNATNSITDFVKERRAIANETGDQKRIRELGDELIVLEKKFQETKQELEGGFNFFGKDKIEVAAELDAIKTGIQDINAERNKLSEKVTGESSAKIAQKEADELKVINDKANQKKLDDLNAQKVLEQEEIDKANKAIIQKAQDTEKQISTLIEQERVIRQLREQEQAKGGTEQAIAVLMERESEITSARVAAEASRADALLQYDEAEKARAEDKQRKLTDATKKGEADRVAAVKKAKEDEFNFVKAKTEAEKNFEEQTYSQRVQTSQKGLAALASLQKSGVREAFTLGKRAAQAQVLLDIPKAAFAAYTSLIGIPFVGPVLAPIAAAAAILAGQQQLRQIEAQQFAEGGLVPGTGNKDTVPALLTPGEVVVPKQNFEDLKTGIGGNSDEIALLQQGNAISARILDQLTIGIVNEQLTRMVALLNDIKSNTVYRSDSSNLPDVIDTVIDERNRNQYHSEDDPTKQKSAISTATGIQAKKPKFDNGKA